MFNLSMKTGTHPDYLKLARVIPIHKKGSEHEVGNYRPITLLSNINKLLETVVHERTYNLLEKFNCLYKYQFGFRKSHSTNHALIEITKKISSDFTQIRMRYLCRPSKNFRYYQPRNSIE